VEEELNKLDDAFDQAAQHYDTHSGIILGDLNADCKYLSKTRYGELDLVTDNRFLWLIDSDADTTTKTTDCAYDR